MLGSFSSSYTTLSQTARNDLTAGKRATKRKGTIIERDMYATAICPSSNKILERQLALSRYAGLLRMFVGVLPRVLEK